MLQRSEFVCNNRGMVLLCTACCAAPCTKARSRLSKKHALVPFEVLNNVEEVGEVLFWELLLDFLQVLHCLLDRVAIFCLFLPLLPNIQPVALVERRHAKMIAAAIYICRICRGLPSVSPPPYLSPATLPCQLLLHASPFAALTRGSALVAHGTVVFLPGAAVFLQKPRPLTGPVLDSQ